MITDTQKELTKSIKLDFARLNDKMVDEAVEMMEERQIPDTLVNFLEALNSTWEAYYMSN